MSYSNPSPAAGGTPDDNELYFPPSPEDDELFTEPNTSVTYSYNLAKNAWTSETSIAQIAGTDLGQNVYGNSVEITSSTGAPTDILEANAVRAGVLGVVDWNRFDDIARNGTPCDLGHITGIDNVEITSSSGQDTVIPGATNLSAGVMTRTQAAQLDAAYNFSQNPTPTDLTVQAFPTEVEIDSSTGNDAVIPAATNTNSGVFLPTEKQKLAAIADGAQVNNIKTVSAPASLSVTGDLSVVPATQLVPGSMSSADKQKLDGIQPGANDYTLPTSSATRLGGIKVGDGLVIDPDGTLNLEFTDNLSFLSEIDLTTDVPSGSEVPGNFYINTNIGGTTRSEWLGGPYSFNDPLLGREIIVLGNDTYWHQIGTASGAGVTTVNVKAPVTNEGTGADPIISMDEATQSDAGAMSAGDKLKLDNIEPGAQQNNIGSVDSPLDLSGGVISIASASGSTRGTMSSSEHNKLQGIEDNAERNKITEANNPLYISGNKIHIHQASSSQSGYMSSSDKSKLDGLSNSGGGVQNAEAPLYIDGDRMKLRIGEGLEVSNNALKVKLEQDEVFYFKPNAYRLRNGSFSVNNESGFNENWSEVEGKSGYIDVFLPGQANRAMVITQFGHTMRPQNNVFSSANVDKHYLQAIKLMYEYEFESRPRSLRTSGDTSDWDGGGRVTTGAYRMYQVRNSPWTQAANNIEEVYTIQRFDIWEFNTGSDTTVRVRFRIKNTKVSVGHYTFLASVNRITTLPYRQ